MIEFLNNLFGFRFDMPEFLTGVVFGFALIWIFTRMRPIFDGLSNVRQDFLGNINLQFSAGSTNRYQAEILTRANTMHLASDFFALDEIVVPPRVLAPPIPDDPEGTDPTPQDTLAVVPNLPDWTFLSGIYSAPTISLADALADGANIMLTGPPGSGKTTALAYLAIKSIRKDPEAGIASEMVPILINAVDLQFDRRSRKDPTKPIITAAQEAASPNLASRIPGHLRPLFRGGSALVLLDGLDLLSPEEMPPIAAWLEQLIHDHPKIRIVAAGPVRGYDGIPNAGLTLVPISPWTEYDQRVFLSRWAQSWQQHIIPSLPKRRIGDVDTALITGWLAGINRGYTPLELTLRTWAAYIGDTRGSRIVDNLEAYITRFLKADEQQQAEAAGLTWINNRQGAVDERSLRRGTPVGDLIKAGILNRNAGKKVSFTQPAVGAYLAARAMLNTGIPETAPQIGWAPAETAMTYFAAMGDIEDVAMRYIQDSDDPLETNLLTCARWLTEIPGKLKWKNQALRALATVASSDERPYGLRLRTIHALAKAGDPSIAILFRRLLEADTPSSRVLGALGLGGLKDEKSVEQLSNVAFQDRNLHVRRAACLALAAIGTEQAMEGLGEVLLGGDEEVRLAAAEAMACHPDEGFAMLKDASEHENLLTRRASVFGLARVPEDWALEILDRVRVEDDQWVVRGAAAEAAERRREPPWKVTPPIKEISELPWLIEFAERVGLGIAPGHAALEMVRQALNKGTPEEKISALETIAWGGGEELGLELYHSLYASEPYLRDGAFEALWRLKAAGKEIPAPEQYGIA